MASGGVKLNLFLAFVIMLYHGASAQSSCTSTLVTLSPCLNYVTGNSSTPSSSCCSKLAAVVQSVPQCLCTFVNGGGSSLGISINQTLALSLPAACSVTTPPASRCNGGASATTASPASSPESPPADSSNDTPPTPTTTIPAGTGSKTVPTTANTSDSSNLGIHLYLTIFLVYCFVGIKCCGILIFL